LDKREERKLVTAGWFAIIYLFLQFLRQAAASAKPFVALSLPQKAEETLCVF
jgi:hypothetical protein